MVSRRRRRRERGGRCRFRRLRKIIRQVSDVDRIVKRRQERKNLPLCRVDWEAHLSALQSGKHASTTLARYWRCSVSSCGMHPFMLFFLSLRSKIEFYIF